MVAVTLAMNYGVIYADKAKQVETLDKKIAEKEENNQEIAEVTKTNEKSVADIKAEYHKATVKEIPNNPTPTSTKKVLPNTGAEVNMLGVIMVGSTPALGAIGLKRKHD